AWSIKIGKHFARSRNKYIGFNGYCCRVVRSEGTVNIYRSEKYKFAGSTKANPAAFLRERNRRRHTIPSSESGENCKFLTALLFLGLESEKIGLKICTVKNSSQRLERYLTFMNFSALSQMDLKPFDKKARKDIVTLTQTLFTNKVVRGPQRTMAEHRKPTNSSKNGSGWRLRRVDLLEIHIGKYQPLRGKGYVPLSETIRKKKAIINMKNDDNECFRWAVTRALNPIERNSERITRILRKQAEKLDWEGIEFPTPLNNIKKFEKNNNIRVNVFGLHGCHKVCPLRISSSAGPINGKKNKKHICNRCLNAFGSAELLKRHLELCLNNDHCRQEVQTVPFVIYADFECYIEGMDTVGQNPNRSSTAQYQKHSPSGFSYYVKCFDDSVYKPRLVHHTQQYVGEDVTKKFVDMLEEEVRDIYNRFKFKEPIKIFFEDVKNYERATVCYACGKEFTTEDHKVRDHCHYTGAYRGAAHSTCNLKMRRPKFIPVLLHNLEGYDAHLFIRNLGVSSEDIKCIPKTEEKYISFTKEIEVDVMENFRKVCKTNYGLDPMWYYTAPGLAWDAALILTGVELDLISDPDMYLFTEKGIRAGISTITKRYARADNKYIRLSKNLTWLEGFKNRDDKGWSTYLPYMDANNLYGWAMSQPLPVRDFKWTSDEELEKWTDYGCILEVDLEYPDELHDKHNEYPLAPERIVVNGVEKLIPNLNNKEKYVVHHETLKLYLSQGLRLTKIHRGVKFVEEPWLEKYIQLNTDLRTKGTTDFEKDFFKLMNNSVFGKTMENVRNRVDIKLVNNEKKWNKLAQRHNYKSATIFSENLVAVHMMKTSVKLNKPIYLGMSILDISKILMYDLHYNYIKPKYGDNAELLFTDTDSLCYEIKTEDFFKDISDDVLERFDTSNLGKDHPSGIQTGVNKKVIGMMKLETGAKQIEEFVGLRSKLYAYKMAEDGGEEKKCKGVKKVVIKKEITFENYKECFFSGEKQWRGMNVFRSRLHEICTERVVKVALSANDDKRIIVEDGIHTLAIGHKSLRQESRARYSKTEFFNRIVPLLCFVTLGLISILLCLKYFHIIVFKVSNTNIVEFLSLVELSNFRTGIANPCLGASPRIDSRCWSDVTVDDPTGNIIVDIQT
ncbi:Hypothetical predicted protein, partial [Paramuricea clavata]